MVKGLIKIASDDLKKADKKALSTLYIYWLENGKKDVFDLPLFIDDNGKGVMSVETFKRIFYAFCLKSVRFFECDVKSGDDGDDGSYNVVRVKKVTVTKDDEEKYFSNFEEPKKADVKRESSKKTAEKSAEKKAKAEAEKVKAEAEADADWNKKASMKIADHLIGKYKLTADRLTLENEIINILNSIKA